MSSHVKRLLAALALASALTGCAVTPLEVLPPGALASAPALPVSGRQGWLPGRELRFGDYATRDLKTRSQTRTASCPNGCSAVNLGLYKQRFDEAFSTSTQRSRFTLTGPTGAEVDVQLTGQLDQQKRDWMIRWFGLPTDFGTEINRQVSVIGTVQPADATQPGWRFALRDDASNRQLHGWVEDDNGRRLSLAPLQRLAGRTGGTSFHVPGALGYAFELDGRVIGAVATMGAGTVWLSPDLPPELRLSLAGLASVLLLRPEPSR
jgi:hypothetical protein